MKFVGPLTSVIAGCHCTLNFQHLMQSPLILFLFIDVRQRHCNVRDTKPKKVRLGKKEKQEKERQDCFSVSLALAGLGGSRGRLRGNLLGDDVNEVSKIVSLSP